MERIRREYCQDIQRAFDNIGPTISDRLRHVHFLTGVSPVFVGLHQYTDIKIHDGHTYHTVAHFANEDHQICLPRARRQNTIVLPTYHQPSVIVHELGHALHLQLDERITVRPNTEYGQTNKDEAFAEAFTSWVYSDNELGTWYRGTQPDPAFVHLMESLLPHGVGYEHDDRRW